jgi:hypothetical protein
VELVCPSGAGRLAEVKAKYDPENVFHNNKSIQPHTPAQ